MVNYWNMVHANLSRQTNDYFWKEVNVIFKSELLTLLDSMIDSLQDYNLESKTVSIQTDTNISQFLCILAVGKCGGIPCPLGVIDHDSKFSQDLILN